MIEIEGKTIRISRGDSGTIKLTIPLSDTENYEFQVGDKVQFRAFEKKNYNTVFLDKEIKDDLLKFINSSDCKFFYNKNKIFEVFKLFYDEDIVSKIKSLGKEE